MGKIIIITRKSRKGKVKKRKKTSVPSKTARTTLRFQMRSRCNAASDKMIEDCLGAPAASNEIAHFTRGQTSWQTASEIIRHNCAPTNCSYFSPPVCAPAEATLQATTTKRNPQNEGGIKQEEQASNSQSQWRKGGCYSNRHIRERRPVHYVVVHVCV